MEKQRIYYWDNLKAILIFLVVLGHFLLPVANVSKIIQLPNAFIYRFHMPAFIFVSGYFAKSYMAKKDGRVNKLIGFIILYIVYKVLLWITESAVLGEITELNFLIVRAAPWYMICMFYWYLVLPIFNKLKPIISIGLAVVLLLVVGKELTLGYMLGVARGIIYFPFFLMGFYFRKEWIAVITSKKIRLIVGVCVCVATVMLIVLNKLSIVLIGNDDITIIWLVRSCVITFIIMCFIPQKETIFTYIGSRTLGIYVMHRIVRQIFENGNLYRFFDGNEIVLLITSIAISLVVTWVFSAKTFNNLFQKAFKLDYKILQKTSKK